MLYLADNYVTVWFMWQLQRNEEVSKSFARISKIQILFVKRLHK